MKHFQELGTNGLHIIPRGLSKKLGVTCTYTGSVHTGTNIGIWDHQHLEFLFFCFLLFGYGYPYFFCTVVIPRFFVLLGWLLKTAWVGRVSCSGLGSLVDIS